MQYHINIITKAGVRLDVDVPIELVMGGMSMLDLTTRFVNRSTSFNMKRTPINEHEFGFSSNPRRYATPSIEVDVIAGIYNFSGVLKVLGYSNGEYSCSLFFTDFNEQIKSIYLKDLLPSDTNILYSGTTMFNDMVSSDIYSLLYSKPSDLFNEATILSPEVLEELGVWVGVPTIMSLIESETGYTFVNVDSINFAEIFYLIRDYTYYKPIGLINELAIKEITDNSNHLCSDIIKSVMHICCSYYEVDELTKKIYIYSLQTRLQTTTTFFENFIINNKIIDPLFAATNRINYNLDSSLAENYKGGSFLSNGVGSANVLDINASIGSIHTSMFLEEYYNFIGVSEIVLGKKGDTGYSRIYIDGYSNLTVNPLKYYNVIDLQPKYSFLESYLKEPIILEVSGNVPNFIARDLMTSKVFDSLKLGGRYFIDQMNYNISSGDSVATLIKLK